MIFLLFYFIFLNQFCRVSNCLGPDQENLIQTIDEMHQQMTKFAASRKGLISEMINRSDGDQIS